MKVVREKIPQVEYGIKYHAAWITMNRPSVLNALSEEMFRELRKSLKAAMEDDRARSVVISGRGTAFSAGLDINQVSGFESRSKARNFVYGLVKPFWDTLFNCEKPIVSMVNGAAYGAGAEIALASDVVVASTESTFAFSGGRIGALCCVSAIIGPLVSGGRRIVEMNLTGEPITAREAREIGLVNYAVPKGKLLATTKSVLEKLSHVSPISNSSFKRILYDNVSRSALDTAYAQLLRTITSPDFKKGSKAFARRQIPNYYC
jgi:enoyl-CoA hydratase/3-hydroxyacyl-CoA dehydrogenase